MPPSLDPLSLVSPPRLNAESAIGLATEYTPFKIVADGNVIEPTFHFVACRLAAAAS